MSTSSTPLKLLTADVVQSWKKFPSQFNEARILIFIGVAVVSAVVSQEIKTPLVVLMVVLIEACYRIPADGRILSAANFKIEETALSSGSQPVTKITDALLVSSRLNGRFNMGLKNTHERKCKK